MPLARALTKVVEGPSRHHELMSVKRVRPICLACPMNSKASSLAPLKGLGFRGYIGVYSIHIHIYIYLGIMENQMETTIYIGLRV